MKHQIQITIVKKMIPQTSLSRKFLFSFSFASLSIMDR